MSPEHSCPDESDITHITSFLQECKAAKYLHSQVQDIEAYSLQPTSTSDMIQAEQERKSIIPDIGLKNPTSDLSHLSPPLQARMQSIIEKHKNLFSRSKHHLGHFKGFKATAEIDKQTRINCRQAPRNRVLPSSVICTASLYGVTSRGPPDGQEQSTPSLETKNPISLELDEMFLLNRAAVNPKYSP